MPRISEKTFELNITSEILDLGKSFRWYLFSTSLHKYWAPSILSDWWRSSTLFCEGLTTHEEQHGEYAGTDIIIKHNRKDGTEARLLFLQFKSGRNYQRCNNPKSKFNSKNVRKGETTEHIGFTFNNNDQHIHLRKILEKTGISEKSVLYVFPRISEISDFKSKIGRLILHTSFISVQDLDKEALLKTKKGIVSGKKHIFRTDYKDYERREVNYYYYYYEGINYVAYLIGELLAIEIERTLYYANGLNIPKDALQEAYSYFKDQLYNFFEIEKGSEYVQFVAESKLEYGDPLEDDLSIEEEKEKRLNIFNQVENILQPFHDYIFDHKRQQKIPKAPYLISSPIPEQGITLNIQENSIKMNNINYQII